MKRKPATRAPWPRVKRKTFAVEFLERPGFSGYVTRLELLEVSPPLWVTCCGERVCVADDGHVWMQYFPNGIHHTLTAMFDAGGGLRQWYFDICQGHGVDAHGIPWWDDLYLDVIGLPDQRFELIDREDLETALRAGEVNDEQHRLALSTADHLIGRLQKRDFPLLELSLELYQTFKNGS